MISKGTSVNVFRDRNDRSKVVVVLRFISILKKPLLVCTLFLKFILFNMLIQFRSFPSSVYNSKVFFIFPFICLSSKAKPDKLVKHPNTFPPSAPSRFRQLLQHERGNTMASGNSSGIGSSLFRGALHGNTSNTNNQSGHQVSASHHHHHPQPQQHHHHHSVTLHSQQGVGVSRWGSDRGGREGGAWDSEAGLRWGREGVRALEEGFRAWDWGSK